jgi:single-strand DNA-binding protein
MADGLNLVYAMGHLGQDPELRVTQSGQSVMTLNIACNESWLDKNRVRQEKVEWVRCVIWGRRAEALSKFLRKGDKIFIEGKLQTSSWEDREGIKRYKTEVVAKNVILGGSNNPRNKPKDPQHRRPSRRDDDEPQGGGGGGYDDSDYGSSGGGYDDEIPFTYITRPDREHWWRF